MSADIDVSLWREHYLKQHGANARIPWTAFLVKVAALMAKEVPEANRVLFKTFTGWRFLQFDYVTINVPVLIKIRGSYHLSAVTIKDADRRDIDEIAQEIRAAKSRTLDELPVSKLIIGRRNSFWNRLRLRLIHAVVARSPRAYAKLGGGGLSVSSLLNHVGDQAQSRPYAFGATALTICASSLEERDGKHWLKLGLGCDHLTGGGELAMRAVRMLQDCAARVVNQ